MNEENNKLPKSVLSYYVQLYCKKRKIDTNKSKYKSLVSEATRSWLNLSASKRKIITMKYENWYLKLRKRFADKLRNTIPFSNKSQAKGSSTGTHSLEDVCNITLEHSEIENDQSFNKNNQSICSPDHQEQIIESNSTHQEEETNQSQLPNASIVKPSPPQFRTTKELYYIINKNTEDLDPWSSLTENQKKKYSIAATRIKRLYLMEYTNYLENLSTEELYKQYKSIHDT
ncbi:uncharacterized protein LOC123694497 isoform X2 [Colias croceus]|uniref:uncharacterized protein LOC123694497 isoform X2 n=1 Tax=Colias crocea TaxID=72248 RepID=UPI001E27FA9F|nr:uncharacterized protein LOC123694497 isoform X2 [Colias croceus]